jgi:hypothetical protein
VCSALSESEFSQGEFANLLGQLLSCLDSLHDDLIATFRSAFSGAIALAIPLVRDSAEHESVLSLIHLLISTECDESFLPLLEFAASSIGCTACGIRALAIDSLARFMAGSRNFGEFIWDNALYGEILSLCSSAFPTEIPAFLAFFTEFVRCFAPRLQHTDLEGLVEFGIQYSGFELLLVILQCDHGLEMAVGHGLLDFVLNLLCSPAPSQTQFLFAVLIRVALEGDLRFLFETEGFFSAFVACFAPADESAQLQGMKLAYFLHPDFSDDLIESGFLGMAIQLGQTASFALSLQICEYLSLAFSDAPLSLVLELMDGAILDIFARFLGMDDSAMTLIVMEILAVCSEADPPAFSALLATSELGEVLQMLTDNDDDLVRQHASVLMESVVPI